VYYRDLRHFLEVLESRGKVHRFKQPVCKDTELVPLLRVQLRGTPDGDDRKVLVFEDVRGASGEKYDMQVVSGVYGLSEEILRLALCCESRVEMLERWHHALAHPIPPVVVESGPVQEELHLGHDLTERGLDEIPAPLEEVGFSQVIRTGTPVVTRHPETGVYNVGEYNGFFRDRNRICAGIGPGQDAMRHHWQAARRRGEDLPIAIVVGCTPNLVLPASCRIPYGLDEFSVAGGLAGEPMQLVPCKTIPLEVPANAEIIIEGLLSIDTLEPRLAFGEYPGYMQLENNNRPVMRVTAITHRKNALFTPVLVGFPPSDSNTISSFCNAALLYHNLRHQCHLPVEDVYVSEMTGGAFSVVRLEKGASRNVWQVLHTAAGLNGTAKYLIAVDYDVDVHDPELLIWALTWRVRPENDIVVMKGRQPGLDPSFGPTGSSRGRMDQSGLHEYHRVLIDATMTGPYPPVALPKREYMERAVEIWREEGLPEPRLRTPWYGYSLGYWSEEDQRLADLMVAGDYKAVGRVAREMQVKADQVVSGH
jgi:4-hydroxy-3-polyprenylbenzoate decarboxylase